MLSFGSINSSRICSTLDRVEKDLQKTMRRLSSGLRINSAADDPAALAISVSMSAQIASVNQATRNANDGSALLQTADQALATSGNALVRMRELAVQAATGTLSGSDRQALQKENDQLAAEVNQIAKSCSYNGLHLLDGSNARVAFQIGPESASNIGLSLSPALADDLGPQGSITIHGNEVNTPFNPSGSLVIDGQSIAVGDSSAKTLAAGINAAGIAGLTAAAGVTSVDLGSISTSLDANGTSYSLPSDLQINGDPSVAGFSWTPPATTSNTTSNGSTSTTVTTSYTATTTTTTTVTTSIATGVVVSSNSSTVTSNLFGQAVAAQITASIAGVSASYAGGKLVLSAADGSNISLSTGGSATNLTSFGNFSTNGGPRQKTALADLSLTASHPVSVSQGLSLSAGQGRDLQPGGYPLSVSSTGMLLSAQRARDFVGVIDTAINQVNAIRVGLGSMENVLGSAAAAGNSSAVNLEASRSQIADADLATESSNLVRDQILQQVGVALLAQANQAGSSALSLLDQTFRGMRGA